MHTSCSRSSAGWRHGWMTRRREVGGIRQAPERRRSLPLWHPDRRGPSSRAPGGSPEEAGGLLERWVAAWAAASYYGTLAMLPH
eukprot:scaffold131068_cov48-Phaeocystis_antarctica.AAC.1